MRDFVVKYIIYNLCRLYFCITMMSLYFINSINYNYFTFMNYLMDIRCDISNP